MKEDLLFSFNAVAPIIFTVAIGYFLKLWGLVTPELAKMANRLVFRTFLPVMIFMNILGINDAADINLGYAVYAAAILVAVFALGIPFVKIFVKNPERRGALLQGMFRSNYAFIGIPLATSLCGDEGAAIATLMSIIVVPTVNMLGVIALSIFSDTERVSVKKVILGILKNPLIVSVFCGMVYVVLRMYLGRVGVNIDISGVGAIWKTLQYMSNLATPLALIMLGAQFEFSAIASLKKEIIIGVLVKCVIVPTIGLGIAYFAFKNSFDKAEFASIIAALATPVSISSVPMAQEMGADSTLAGQLVIFTTLSSAITIFVATFVMKSLGVL